MRILAILATVLVTLSAFLAGAAWFLLQPTFITGLVADTVAARSGLVLRSEGPPRVSLYPQTLVTLANVTLTPADGSARFAAGRELELAADPIALFAGRLEVSAVTLRDARIGFLASQAGKVNWPERPSALDGLPPVTVENATVSFIDEKTGLSGTVAEGFWQLVALPGGGFSLNGRAVANGQPLRIDLAVKALDRLTRDGTPASLTISAPSLEFGFDGRMRVADGLELAGQAHAATPSTAALARWLGRSLPAMGDIARAEIDGAIDAHGRTVAFGDARLRLGGEPATGDLSLSFEAAGPSLTGTLDMGALDLSRPIAARSLPEQWSTSSLQLPESTDFAVNLTIETTGIEFAGLRTGSARLTLAAGDGEFNATLGETALLGGRIGGRLSIGSKAPGPVLALSAVARGLEAPWGLGRLSALSIELSGTGRSQAEFASTLAGFVETRMEGGTLPGLDVDALFRSVGGGIVNGWPGPAERGTAFDTLSATFKVEDGIATTADLSMSGAGAGFVARGEIDVLRQAIDLKAEPRGGTAALPVPVIARGPWLAPKFYPDMPGILDNPEAGYAALKKLVTSR